MVLLSLYGVGYGSTIDQFERVGAVETVAIKVGILIVCLIVWLALIRYAESRARSEHRKAAASEAARSSEVRVRAD
jgi:hypothetical protein